MQTTIANPLLAFVDGSRRSALVPSAAGYRGIDAVGADVRAPLTFIVPTETKPRFYSSAWTGGAPQMLFDSERHVVPVHDMRPLEGALSLDREGFELLRHRSAVADLYDDEAIESRYKPEIEDLLKGATGADRVVVFDVTRRSDDGTGARNRDGLRGPASRVHVDYTEASGPQRVRDILGEAEAARLAESGARIVQVNVWRPIRGPVERSPLALADAGTVRPRELVATDQIFPDRVGEIYHLSYAPTQRWYFAPRMTPDEVLLIKGWDSLDDGRARFTPHSAVELPDTPAAAAPRESIEVRTLMIFEA
ncbi:hypothetical protein SAMN06265365_105174 [Tistlia consotensis]|uniref:Methyltransferase n=1 Tax=Tistlia consotensis USBA 355 TaxID=560819 RepID=A0A1Y6BJJ8_9PROT|nr:CmcJ/NvfI family oxidoreductase [Tistlia consotensis]SMF12979.1 hypothetical protein SAMN05428998_105124 [Tistlia consotensis USBA 355]SNR50792.1 hypothetical protein SAMN06265365_105174 [Tistlia consotensis]